MDFGYFEEIGIGNEPTFAYSRDSGAIQLRGATDPDVQRLGLLDSTYDSDILSGSVERNTSGMIDSGLKRERKIVLGMTAGLLILLLLSVMVFIRFKSGPSQAGVMTIMGFCALGGALYLVAPPVEIPG